MENQSQTLIGNEAEKQTVPMEELAQVVFQKDIYIATLLKQLKEADAQIKMQAELLGQMVQPEKAKPTAVVAEEG